ncbi:Uncharacterised protein g419 [Pycnogonum litorale]
MNIYVCMSLLLFCTVAEGRIVFQHTFPQGANNCDFANTDVYNSLMSTYGKTVWSIGKHRHSGSCKEISCLRNKYKYPGQLEFVIKECTWLRCPADKKKVSGPYSAAYPNCCPKCVNRV